MVYRAITEERLEQVADLWDYCFEKKDDPFFKYYFQNYCFKQNMVLGGFEKQKDCEKLRSMVHINPYRVRMRGVEQMMPYLVGVATAPEYRGQHLFEPLLQTVFKVLRSEHIRFVNLMPIYAGIYQPYEFAYTCYRHEYAMPLDALQLGKVNTHLVVEHVPLSPKLLAPIYEQIMAKMHATVVRNANDWEKILAVHALENVQCAVVWRDGHYVGYMLYKIADDTFTIIEFLAENQAVRERLLFYVKMHQSSASKLYWLAEAWDKTYLRLADQKYTGKLVPFMMSRCLDALRALSCYRAPAKVTSASVVVKLTDSVLVANNHLLRLTVEDGNYAVEASEDKPQVVMNMGAFTQMYMGTFLASELWEAGQITCTDASKLAFLDELFPEERNYINEYF